MKRPVVFTGDIFRLQPFGGISRYFEEIVPRLERPVSVVAGVHQSRTLADVPAVLRSAARVPGFRGHRLLREPVNRWIDRLALSRVRQVIVHPTYYRDPRTLPASEPVVLTVHDMTHERFPEVFRRRRLASTDPAVWKAALCARADRILCNSESTRQDVERFLAVPAAKLRVAHHAGRDWSRTAAEPIAGVAAPFLLWVGERHSHKNFLLTLEAWAGCAAATGTSLLCAGGGRFGAAERARIAALGVADRVRQVTCSDGQLRWAYEQAHGLLYTSLWEGFGLPVVEAMSLGCPVVVSNLSALPEVAGDAGIYVDPRDLDSLRAGIARCLEAGRGETASAALRARAARFSWDACAAVVEAAYRELD